MFKVGDKVVSLLNYKNISYNLYEDEIYEIKSTSIDGSLIQIVEHPYQIYNKDKFISIIKYRKLKIEKLKKNICLKKVI